MTRKKFLAAAAGVAASMVAARDAFAQNQPVRGEVGSARNIVEVRRALERLIDQLQHDQHDFGGYRVRAIEDLRRARQNLTAALQWDATHSH